MTFLAFQLIGVLCGLGSAEATYRQWPTAAVLVFCLGVFASWCGWRQM